MIDEVLGLDFQNYFYLITLPYYQNTEVYLKSKDWLFQIPNNLKNLSQKNICVLFQCSHEKYALQLQTLEQLFNVLFRARTEEQITWLVSMITAHPPFGPNLILLS